MPPEISKDVNSLILEGFQQERFLSLKNKEYRRFVQKFLEMQLKEDVKKKDLTTSFLFSRILPDKAASHAEAEIIAKQKGILAGLEEFKFFCEMNQILVNAPFKDGDKIRQGDKALSLSGALETLLRTERVGLDLLGRMSGIATAANELVQKVNKISKTKIAATRKTLWGNLDKKAVFLGGGLTHRLGLWQAVLVKENHLTALKSLGIKDPFSYIKDSLSSLKFHDLMKLIRGTSHQQRRFPSFFEIEVETIEQGVHVGELLMGQKLDFSFALLLDNFSSLNIRKIVKIFSKRSWDKKILLEASGGITPSNLMEYAETGVDLISMGFLTHSVKHFDFSQKITAISRKF